MITCLKGSGRDVAAMKPNLQLCILIICNLYIFILFLQHNKLTLTHHNKLTLTQHNKLVCAQHNKLALTQ